MHARMLFVQAHAYRTLFLKGNAQGKHEHQLRTNNVDDDRRTWCEQGLQSAKCWATDRIEDGEQNEIDKSVK